MPNNRYLMFEEQDFAVETFAAFAAAAQAHAVDTVSEDISEEHGFVYKNTSAKRLARNRKLGPRVSGGEVGVPFYTRGTPTLIYYALGAITTTTEAAGPPENFKHVIVPSTTIPAFRLAVGKDINEHQFVGCAVKSCKIDYTVDDDAIVTLDLLVRKELAPATLQTPTFPDYDIKERSFLGTEVTAKVDGSDVGYVRSLSIEIDNDVVEDNHAFGSRFLPYLRVQGLTITGTITIAFDDIARYNDVLNEAENKFEFIFSTGTLGQIDYRDVHITLPKVSYDSGKLPTDANNEYVLEVNFTAEVDPGVNENGIEIVIHNDEAGAELAL